MAVFTPLTAQDADRVSAGYGLPKVATITGLSAGSVNTNYFLDWDSGRRLFLRIYEEQGPEGVDYEWRLLAALGDAGFPVPSRVVGPGPDALLVAGKPTALFECIGGVESCQALVSPARAEAVGRMLGRVHAVLQTFPERRAGRFTRAHVGQRLDRIRALARPELTADEARLRALLADVDASEPRGLTESIIHSDLFRDNIRWDGDRIVAIIDWESASAGACVYDLMVTVLAWTYGATFDWDLARAMVRGYLAEHPLTDADLNALRWAGRAACLRFATTRITDYHLRRGEGGLVHREYARFLARLDALEGLSATEVCQKLTT